MSNEDEYSKLIELVNEFNEHTDGSMTHINRSKRVIRGIADNNLLIAQLIVKNMAFLPPEEFKKLKDAALAMSSLMEEFADFLQDYGEDLVKIGTDVVDIFQEFQNCMEKK